MATPQRKPFVSPQQVRSDQELFEASPYRIISKFLVCFDRNGRHEMTVPGYVLEALAERFISVNSEQEKSLDRAFGGRIARQRDAARMEERNWDVLWDVRRRHEKLRAMSKAERGVGSPIRIAIGQCAEKYKMKPGTVRRIYYGKKMGKFSK